MKKLLTIALLACASVTVHGASSNPALNVVELSITGSAVDEGENGTVALRGITVDKRKVRKYDILYADPSIYTEDGKYYLSGTRSFGPEGFTLLESHDLKNWDYARKDSLILRKGEGSFGTKWFWAPQIFKDGDRYLFTYAADEKTAIASSTSLTGPYTQEKVDPVDGSAGNIDPFIFKDDDGKYYFYHVRFNGGNFIWVGELDPTTLKIVDGTLKQCLSITQGWENTNAYPSAPIMEGPTVVKIDNLYYLFYSANHYLSTDYAVGYATAPSPTGPWTKNPDNPIINRNIVGEMGSGHGDVFFDTEGNMRYVYHVHNSLTQANPRRTRILTLDVDKSAGEPYKITADTKSIIYPTEGLGSGTFEGYVRLKPGKYHFIATLTNGDKTTYGQTDGTMALEGDEFTIEEEGVMRVTADIYNKQVTITPAGSIEVHGSVASDGTTIDYAGNGIWSSEVTLDNPTTGEYINRNIYFTLSGDETKTLKRVPGTNSLNFVSDSFTGENIRINQGTYTISVDLNTLTFSIDGEIDPYRISVFGSSVANGQGAEYFRGYAYMYGELLKSRHENGTSQYPFYTSGVSIGGNTTTALKDRYEDLTRDFGQYVLFGLSLGNEGLHEATNPRTVYTQFSTNMLGLIDDVRADGKTPVVMNNYTRGDYTSTDYSYIQQMNLLIHEWDVPSVNTLGAIDNGAGQWATGYVADAFHPNTSGHREFMYAMVPSLFDALADGKPLPTRDITGEYILTKGATLNFNPEETTHSFTISLRVKGGDAGRLLSLMSGTRTLTEVSLDINADGTLTYNSSKKESTTTEKALLADDAYHFVTLTHYYAWGRTLLYVDNKSYITVTENLIPSDFVVGDKSGNASRAISELAFWRAGMNAKEVISHGAKRMLKSSLELYVPLTAETTEVMENTAEGETSLLPNRAQSLNAVSYTVPDNAGVTDAVADTTLAVAVSYCTPDGRIVPASEAHDGIFIVRYSDGTVRKLKL